MDRTVADLPLACDVPHNIYLSLLVLSPHGANSRRRSGSFRDAWVEIDGGREGVPMTSQDGDDHTRNHGYNTPPEGATDWHLDLNENFDRMDTDVEIRDTEGNKGDYEPKEGAKYEATDSGAVYYGNGSSWVLADREVSSMQAESLNSIRTPQDTTIQAIQAIVDNNQHVYIRLEPGKVYEGDTQLVLDSLQSDGTEKEIIIDAYGAAVNYTGSKKTAVRCLQDGIQPISRGDGSAFGGQIKIVHGSWSGPGGDVSDSATLREDDTFGTILLPSEVGDAEHGVLAVNNGGWSEGGVYGVSRSGGYQGGDLSVSRPKYLVRFAGNGSDFPDAGINGGGNSFRDTNCKIEFSKAANESGAVTFWQDHANTHGAHHVVKGFLPRGGTGYRIDGGGANNRTTTLEFESEGGDQDSTAIYLNSNRSPVLLNPRIVSAGTKIEIGPEGATPRIYGERNINKQLRVTLSNDGGWGNTWFTAVDPADGTDLYKITNRKGAFALQAENDSFVGAFGSSNQRIPMQGQQFEAQDPNGSGRRAIKGTFDEHPEGENGDTWYITGNGGPSEGFYGRISSGIVQLA